ncbi:TRAP transporter small permease [Nitrogeniibacter mangrovi]|uniref:TRAP transporter small permease protein n=1 Tax=Nitrogeniibacter mangrovi TaxID=2016596 RepID=A0A6C1B564_9RHOO|nr:TRAP transporter small permease [Nitrogeniibacter mangrovi]QID18607.1 TRAP transporter small permease [Nitrogeniibacter mangrovi]
MTGERSRFSRAVESFEETFIAVALGLMTLITFANVVARYVFNDNILWALEVTVVLFAWLVLVGASYGVKKTFHIGVDVVINILPPPLKKLAALLTVIACLAFSILLLKGAWDYWYPFATDRVWMETNDIPMPDFLRFIEPLLNEGEAYEKLPRFIPYFALPLGMALLVFRFIQAGFQVLMGTRDSLIASHEVEEMLEEAVDAHADGHHHNADRALKQMQDKQNKGA